MKPLTLAVVVLVALLAAVTLGRVAGSRQPVQDQQLTSFPTPSAAPGTAVAENLARDLLSGQSGSPVVLTESQINDQIRETLQARGVAVPLRDVRIHLRPDGKVDVAGTTSFSGADAQVQATISFTAQHGTVDVTIDSVQAGGMALPPIVADQIAQQVAQAAGIGSLHGGRLPAGIDSAVVQDGKLVITRS